MKTEKTKMLIRWCILGAIGAVLTILAAGIVVPALSYLLSFAAGAMLYVVVEELIPEMSQGQHSNVGTVFFAVGFSVMMVDRKSTRLNSSHTDSSRMPSSA